MGTAKYVWCDSATAGNGPPPKGVTLRWKTPLHRLSLGRMHIASTTGLIAILLGACSQVTARLPPAPPVPGEQPNGGVKLPPYPVQVGDVLDIKLFLNPELNEEVTVRPDGMISTTLAQDVPAFGHSPTEIAAYLTRRYRTDLKTPIGLTSPRVSVIVHSFAPNRVYVAGEVGNPGEFVTIGPNLTVGQAIARAGGVKLSGDRDHVFILRRDGNDVAHALAVNYLGIMDADNPLADVRLAQYDVVVVPRTGAYEVFSAWNQYIQQFMPVSWGFSYSVNPSVTTGH
jgi:polysaccharide export outer membrane protein